MPLVIDPPAADEYADFHKGYIAAVSAEPDAVALLERQQHHIETLRRLTPDHAGYRYAEGKWTIRSVIGHLSDTERILSYRLLRIARGDETPLPGFDESSYAAQSNADRRTLSDLVDELWAVRVATLSLVRSLDPSHLARRGVVNNWNVSVRGLAFVIAGHFQHHMTILRERYGVVS
jgi:hypothetical protein